MSWRNSRLGDVVTLKRGHDLPDSKRQAGDVPVVSSSGITRTLTLCPASDKCFTTLLPKNPLPPVTSMFILLPLLFVLMVLGQKRMFS